MPKIQDSKPMMSDDQNENTDYMLMGFANREQSQSGIICCPYVPELLTDEEYAKRYLAGKTFAFVKKDYPNELYADKECEVLETKEIIDGKMYLLKIDVSYKAVEYVHQAVINPKYEETWFKEKDIERFLKYDSDGKIIE